MTHLIDILTADWESGNVTQPANGKGEENEFIIDYYEGYVAERIAFNDMYVGIINSNHFSRDSHDMYKLDLVAESLATFDDVLLEIKRICSQHEPSSEENIITWQGGDINGWNNTRYSSSFIILLSKTGISLT